MARSPLRRALALCLVLSLGVAACEGTTFRCDPSPSWSSRGDVPEGGVASPCDEDGCRAFEVALGPRHSCVAILRDRELVCFGANEVGQSAPHVEADEVPPTRVDQRIASSRYADAGAMALGDGYSCAIYDDSTICWGSERIVGEGASDLPVVMPWRDASWLSGGALHGCANFVGLEGELRERRCFGVWDGVDPAQPGDASRVIDDVVWASAGFRSAALAGGDGVGFVAWGGVPPAGPFGGGVRLPPPRRIPGVPGLGGTLVLGALHGCGLTSDARFACWGDGRRGALGTGAPVDDEDAPGDEPIAATTLTSLCAGGRVEVALDGGSASVLGTTGGHTCAVAFGNEVYCWGANEHGQVGDGTTEDRAAPTRIDAPPANDIYCGGAHTCITTSEGEVWCWGDNTYGQLGVPLRELEWSATPLRVDLTAAFRSR